MVLRRVLDAAGCNDRPLSQDKSGNGRVSTYRSGVCQADGRILEVRRIRFSFSNPVENLVVLLQELSEIKRFCLFNIRDEQCARAVFTRDVHGDSQIDAMPVATMGFTVTCATLNCLRGEKQLVRVLRA